MKENFWFVNGKKVTVSQEVYSLLRYSYAKEREIESGVHTKKYSQEMIYFTELQPWHFQKQTGWMEEKVLDRVVVEQIMESLSEKERLFQMKKMLSAALALCMMFTLSACSGNVVAIEDYEWKMRTVASNDIETAQTPDELIIAVGEADELYPEAEIVDLTLIAKDGEITITDATNGKIYSGTYEVMQKTSKGTDYEIIIDDVTGYATAAPTEYYDGSEIPTLPVNIDDYSLYFVPKE